MAYPKHIAIIMDGNGRWAQKNGLSRIQGHRRGVETVRKILVNASRSPVDYLTLYAFSTENWQRPRTEVRLLMKLLGAYAVRERPTFQEHDVRVRVIGDMSRLPKSVSDDLLKTVELTKDNKSLSLQLALSYSGRDEIIRAVNKVVQERPTQPISSSEFEKFLDTDGIPDPDLIIRTSGEQRISNFLLWQAAYSEFYFTEKFWPEFGEDDFLKAIESYQYRKRRFGALEEAV